MLRPSPPIKISPGAPTGTVCPQGSMSSRLRSSNGSPIGLSSKFASRSAEKMRRNVTWTVVSVIPYMFARRGLLSPCRSNHGRRSFRRRASPPKIIQRNAEGRGNAAFLWVVISSLNADGVWLSTVTLSLASNSTKAEGSRPSSRGTTTQRPPCSKAPHISQTEKSKANE